MWLVFGCVRGSLGVGSVRGGGAGGGAVVVLEVEEVEEVAVVLPGGSCPHLCGCLHLCGCSGGAASRGQQAGAPLVAPTESIAAACVVSWGVAVVGPRRTHGVVCVEVRMGWLRAGDWDGWCGWPWAGVP